MGGVLSCGRDNEDLVNMLIFYGYIRSKSVERVFRAVDRGDYLIPSQKNLAYKDLAWKFGNFHLSAPCVYCEVMQGLTLKPGLSFLNIGSGTGYLSTMAGLILGRNGTNHGIEIHEDCLMYAYDHLEAFKSASLDVDSFEFCEPVFNLGNILNVTPSREYDRVYCGAACPEIHVKYIKQFVKIGGILVMPYKDGLVRIERTGETTWRNTMMLPVSFESLVAPSENREEHSSQLPLSQPQSLKAMCRSLIRSCLRHSIWLEYKNVLEIKSPITKHTFERNSVVNYDEDEDVEDVEMLDRTLSNFSPIEDPENVSLTADESKSNSSKEPKPPKNIDTKMPEDSLESSNDGSMKPDDISSNPERAETSIDTKDRVPGDNSKNKSATGYPDLLDSESDSENDDNEDEDDNDNDSKLDYDCIAQAFSIVKEMFGTETEQNLDNTSESSDSSGENFDNTSEKLNNRVTDNNFSESDDDQLFERFFKTGESNDSNVVENSMPSSHESSASFNDTSDKTQKNRRYGRKRRSRQSNSSDSSVSDPDYNTIYEHNVKGNSYTHRIKREKIAYLMRFKINNLPLPRPLRLYLNHHREL